MNVMSLTSKPSHLFSEFNDDEIGPQQLETFARLPLDGESIGRTYLYQPRYLQTYPMSLAHGPRSDRSQAQRREISPRSVKSWAFVVKDEVMIDKQPEGTRSPKPANSLVMQAGLEQRIRSKHGVGVK